MVYYFNLIMISANKRIIWIDVIRAVACFCVLCVHSPAPYVGQDGQYLLAPLNYIFMAWGVSVFFMISGALLFSKEQKLVPFYKKRMSKILIPIIIWTIIYLVIDKYILNQEDSISIFEHLLLIPFYEQTSILWFMYALIGIYLISPIISTWLQKCSKRDIEIILGLWGVTLLLPYLALWNRDVYHIIEVKGILNYFFGFVGYSLWGYYLMTYVNISIKSFPFLIFTLLTFLMPILIYFIEEIPSNILNSSLSFLSVMMASVAFLFFKGINYKESNFLKFILLFAELSFGIYLCHMLFMKPIQLWIVKFHMHYALQIPLVAFISGILSFIFVWLLSKIPYNKFFIG